MQRLLGTHHHARATTNAARGIDQRMQRDGFGEPRRVRVLARFVALLLEMRAPAHEPRDQKRQGKPVDEVVQIVHEAHSSATLTWFRHTAKPVSMKRRSATSMRLTL